jgi:predicted nucleic acid-binding protein
MEKIDFNDNFAGFIKGEDILVDTGVLFAYLNRYDSWYLTVSNLFTSHVFGKNDSVLLYINPCIQTEFTSLLDSNKLFEKLSRKYPEKDIRFDEVERLEYKSIEIIKELINKEILIVIEHDKEMLLRQLELYKEFGSVDAANISMANALGISFLTVDFKLANKISDKSTEFTGLRNLYYTNPSYQTT